MNDELTGRTRLRAVTLASADVRAAKKRLTELLKGLYPENANVTWEWNGHLQHGVVIMCADRRLKVRNARTGRVRWLDMYWLRD